MSELKSTLPKFTELNELAAISVSNSYYYYKYSFKYTYYGK